MAKRKGRRRTPGLVKVGQVWHVDKRVRGFGRVCESTGAERLEDAEEYLQQRIEGIRRQLRPDYVPDVTFEAAAAKYIVESEKESIALDAEHLAKIMPYIGGLPLRCIHDETLKPFIEHRRREGRKSATVERTLASVRMVLSAAHERWRHFNGEPWLRAAPIISRVDWGDAQPGYPLTWTEENLLLGCQPLHLAKESVFASNTGAREQEVVQLRWEWETHFPGLGAVAFWVPASVTKNTSRNKEGRYLILNSVARAVVDSQRGLHPDRVFLYRGQPVNSMNNTAWENALARAIDNYSELIGRPCPERFRSVSPHDLRHTYATRLRAFEVSEDDRADLLGHHRRGVTRLYSHAQIAKLVAAAERIASLGGLDDRVLSRVRREYYGY